MSTSADLVETREQLIRYFESGAKPRELAREAFSAPWGLHIVGSPWNIASSRGCLAARSTSLPSWLKRGPVIR